MSGTCGTVSAGVSVVETTHTGWRPRTPPHSWLSTRAVYGRPSTAQATTALG